MKCEECKGGMASKIFKLYHPLKKVWLYYCEEHWYVLGTSKNNSSPIQRFIALNDPEIYSLWQNPRYL